MTPGAPPTPLVALFLLLLALLVFTVFYAIGFFFIEEDSYIYYRVAENIASGQWGYVFNRGDPPIECGSAPLWQFLLAAGAETGIGVVQFSKFLGFGLGVSALLQSYSIGRLLASPILAAMAVLLLATNVSFVWWTGSGMEVPLYTVLILWCVQVALAPGPLRWIGVAPFVLLPFARPEALSLLAVFLVFFALHSRKEAALRVILAAGTAYAGYLVFRFLYFDEVQVSAFYAKAADSVFSWTWLWFQMEQTRIALLLVLVLPALVLARDPRQLRALRLLVALGTVGMLFAGSQIDLKPYYRFLSPTLAILFLASACAADVLGRRLRPTMRWALWAYVAVSCVLIIGEPRTPHVFFSVARNPYHAGFDAMWHQPMAVAQALAVKLGDVHRHTPVDSLVGIAAPDDIVNYNRQAVVGHFLRQKYPPGITIGYDQMGQAPYFAGHGYRFLDFLGLTSRPLGLYYFGSGVRKGPRGLYKAIVDPLVRARVDEDRDVTKSDALDYVEKAAPDVVLIHTVSASQGRTLTHYIAASDWLRANYVRRYRVAGLVDVYEKGDRSFPIREVDSSPLLQLHSIE